MLVVRICLLLLVFSFQFAHAKRVAVLELRSVDLEQKLLRQVADDIRSGVLAVSAGKTIDGQPISVLTRENMLDVLKSMGKDASCIDGSCEVEIGRNIGADFILSGEVNRFERMYVLSLKLHNTEQGTLLAADKVRSKSQVDLMDSAKILSSDLIQKANIFDKGPSSYRLRLITKTPQAVIRPPQRIDRWPNNSVNKSAALSPKKPN